MTSLLPNVEVHHTACTLDCPDTCSLAVTVTDGRITDVDAAPGNPLTDGWICAKVKRHARRVYAPERVMTPMVRTGAEGLGRVPRGHLGRGARDDQRSHARGDRYRRPRRDRRLHLQLVGTGEREQWSDRGLLRGHRRNTGRAHHLRGDGQRRVGERVRRHAVGRPAARGRRTTRRRVGRQPDGVEHTLPAARAAGGRSWRQVGGHRSAAHGDGQPCRSAPGGPPRHRCRPGDGHRQLVAAPTACSTRPSPPSTSTVSTTSCSTPREWTIDRAAQTCGLDPDDIVTLAQWYGTTRPAMLRIGWGQERNANGGASCRAILALPALAGHFGVRGGGAIGSTSDGTPVRTRRRWPTFDRQSRRTLNMHQVGAWLAPAPTTRARCCSCRARIRPSCVPINTQWWPRFGRDDVFTVVHDQVLTDTARLRRRRPAGDDRVRDRRRRGQLRLVHRAACSRGHRPSGLSRSNDELGLALAQRMGLDWTAPTAASSTMQVRACWRWARCSSSTRRRPAAACNSSIRCKECRGTNRSSRRIR